MLKEKTVIQICIAMSVLLLPLAHLKAIVFGMPLYSVEMPVVAALMVYLYGWRRGIFAPLKNIDFRNLLVLGAGLFFLGTVLSFVLNPFSLTGLGMIKTWFVVPLIALWLWIETTPEKRDIDRILFVWLCSVAAVSFVSLGYVLQDIFTYDGRLAAWYLSPNYLSFFVAPGVLLIHYFYFHPRVSKKKILQGVLFFILILLMTILFSTHSYTAWMSILVAEVFLLFFDKRMLSSMRGKATVLFLLMIIAGIFLFSESGSEKWQSLVSFQERSSIASRMTIWEVATRVAVVYPLFGIGVGRFQEVYLSYQQYFPPYPEWAVPQPHSLYLALWLQTGLVGFFGFVLLTGVWLKQLFVLQQSQDENIDTKRLSAFFIAMLLFYLLLGLVDTPFFKTDLAFIFWLLIAFGISLIKKQKKSEEETSTDSRD